MVFMAFSTIGILQAEVSPQRAQAQVVFVTPLGVLPLTEWVSYEL